MIQRPLLDAVRRVVAECTPRDCRECDGTGEELAGSNDDVVPCSWCGGSGRNYSGQGATVADVIETCVARGILPPSVMDDPRRFACSECGRVVADGPVPVVEAGPSSAAGSSTALLMFSGPIANFDAVGMVDGTLVFDPITNDVHVAMRGEFVRMAAACDACSNATSSALPLTMDAFLAWASLGFGQPPTKTRCPCGSATDGGDLCGGYGCDACLGCGGEVGWVHTPVGVDTAEALAREVVGALREYGHRGSVERVVWRMVSPDPSGSDIAWENGDFRFGENGSMFDCGITKERFSPTLRITPPSAAAALVRMGLRFGPITGDVVTIHVPMVSP